MDRLGLVIGVAFCRGSMDCIDHSSDRGINMDTGMIV